MKLSEIKKAYLNDKNVSFYDNSIARFVFRPISFFIAYFLIKLKFTPNFITLSSIIVPLALIPVILFSPQQYFGILLFSITLVWVILDYVDGTMARAMDKKSNEGHFFDLTGAYLTFLWLYPLLGLNGYYETSNVIFLFIGPMTSAFTLYPRLLNAKHASIFMKDDERIQMTKTGNIYEIVDSLFSMRGLFIPLWAVSLYINSVHVFILIYLLYYTLVSVVITVKLNSRLSL